MTGCCHNTHRRERRVRNSNINPTPTPYSNPDPDLLSSAKKWLDVVMTRIVERGEFEGNIVFNQSELTYRLGLGSRLGLRLD
jgi:hypothetical protein